MVEQPDTLTPCSGFGSHMLPACPSEPGLRNIGTHGSLHFGKKENFMSIRKMIALHPASKDHVNQPLGDAVHHLMYCAKMCMSCADACMAEAMDMAQCIRLCLDCSDICEATARLGLRRTGDDQPILRELLELCARMCEQCAAECERHDHEHCRLCAQICRECASDCAKAAASLA